MLKENNRLCAVCPLGQLVGVDRILVLLVVDAHRRGMGLQGVGGHALVDVILGKLHIAGELDVVILDRLVKAHSGR